MNTVKLLETAKTMAVKAKPFVVPMLGALVTTVINVKTEQKAEARLINLEDRIKELELLKK